MGNCQIFCRLFPISPPRVLKVDARQFPVVPYFERHTPDNYMEAAFIKVCEIHENKPPGTILVFLTGRLEVGLQTLSIF